MACSIQCIRPGVLEDVQGVLYMSKVEASLFLAHI